MVYGRRRQGKSFLLRRLVAAQGGIYCLALEEQRRPALERFARCVAEALGAARDAAVRWIAATLGRDARSLWHPLDVLWAGGFIRRSEDVLTQRWPIYAVSDPIIGSAC